MAKLTRLQGYAFAKKKGDTIHVFEGPHTLADFMPVIADGTDVPRMLKDRFADVVNVKDFGAKGDGVTDDTAAFNAAGETGKAVYVPGGTYRLSNPYDVAPAYRYFGEGKLVFTVAEQRRRGGSSGGVDIPERYTILYLFKNQSDVSVSFDGVPQEITWVSATTVEAPGSAFGVDVRIKTANLNISPKNRPWA